MAKATWGRTTTTPPVEMHGVKIQMPMRQQPVQRWASGPEIDRTAQDGYTKARLSTFSLGRVAAVGTQSWLTALNSFVYNPGLQTRAGIPVLPYAQTIQTSLSGEEDISGLVAAGGRRHELFTGVGSTSGGRYVAGMGTKFVRAKATNDPDIEVETAFTDSVTDIFEGVVNNTASVIICTNGATDDIKYSTDVTASTVTWTLLVALAAGDYIATGDYFPTVGGKPFIAFVGTIQGVAAIWYILTTVAPPLTAQPVVLLANKDVEGTIAPVTASAIYGQSLVITSQITNTTLNDPTNIAADDGNYATVAWIATGSDIKVLATGIAAPSGVARSARLTGFLIEIQCKESNADDNIILKSVQVLVGGSAVGPSFSMSNGGSEIATTDTTYSVGTSTSNLGLNLTVGDLESMGLEFTFQSQFGSSPSLTIDFVRITPTYRVPGDLVGFPKGGWGIGRSPFDERMIAWVVPVATDTGITLPRRLYTGVFSWDNNGDRPVISLEYANRPGRPDVAGLAYIHDANWFGGGIIVTGSGAAGPGTSMIHIDSNNEPRDFQYRGWNGKFETRVNTIYTQKNWLIFEEVKTDYTDRQWVMWNNARTYPDTLTHSLASSGIAAQPIPCGRKAVDLQQNIIYSFYPNSTSTRVIRQFLPPDLSQDPRTVWTSETRTMGFSDGTENVELGLTLPEIDLGPEEAGKTVNLIHLQSRRISATDGNYGPARMKISTTGDTTFASPDINTGLMTTGLGSGRYAGVYKVPDAGEPYRTIIPYIGITHEAGTAKSPDCGPWIISTVQKWYLAWDVIILLDAEATWGKDRRAWQDKMLQKMEEQAVNPLSYEGQRVGDSATFEGIVEYNRIQQAVMMASLGQSEAPEAYPEMAYGARFTVIDGQAAPAA